MRIELKKKSMFLYQIGNEKKKIRELLHKNESDKMFVRFFFSWIFI